MTRHPIRLTVLAALLVGLPASILVVGAGSDPSDARVVAARAASDVKTAVAREYRRDASLQDSTRQVPESVPAQQFIAITPYRSFDSRVNMAFKPLAGEAWTIDVRTDYENRPMIPSNATAVAFNITLTGTETTFGFVTVFNGDAPSIPQSSTVNWALQDFTIANGGIVALGGPGYEGEIGVAIDGAPDGATEFIIDITGYFAP